MELRNGFELRHPKPPTGGFRPFGPEMSRGVSKRVSPKIRVSEGVSGGVSFGPGPRVSKRCPESVSRESFWPQAPETLPRTLPPVGGWGCLNFRESTALAER